MAVSLSLVRYLSISDNTHSFTVNYLINSCGLSPKSALSASKTVSFESSEKPDSVLSSLNKIGFPKTQISEMVKKYPQILNCKPEKTISPKVEFFRSKGVSTPELVKIFTINPMILRRSLKNRLVSTFNTLVEVFQSEYTAIEVIKRNPWVIKACPEARLRPNINTLKEFEVPESNILWLIHNHWVCIGTNPVNFRKTVEEVKDMGFHPRKSQFTIATMILTVLRKSTKDRKVEIFKSWGWSDKDIITAFKKYPWCLAISEDKLKAVIDFYVNKCGLDSSVIVNCPLLLGYSLNKRLIPRGAVIQFLLSKGLVELDSGASSIFICPEKSFLKKFVNCQKEAPLLISLYYDKLHEATSKENKSKL